MHLIEDNTPARITAFIRDCTSEIDFCSEQGKI
jgi:hypothetical protein